MDALIVGAGEMGRWFAHTLRDELGAEIAFTDIDSDAAATAADAVGGRTCDLDGTERFGIVCLAVPISAVEEAIAEHADRAERAIVDVTGVMSEPVAAMATHAPDRERLSLHPLFASERAPGRIAAVSDVPGPVTDAICDALTDGGNRLFETTPEEHDAAMESIQAKAHAAVLAYALAADDVPERFSTPVSTRLDDLVDLVTDGQPAVYAEIQDAFDGAEDVAQVAREIADADRPTFERLYRSAGEQ